MWDSLSFPLSISRNRPCYAESTSLVIELAAEARTASDLAIETVSSPDKADSFSLSDLSSPSPTSFL